MLLANTSISLGILECLPTGESQCPGVVGTGIGDSAAQEGQRKDPGDEVLNQSTLLRKGQQWRSAGEIPTDIDTSGSGGRNRKAGPRKTRYTNKLYNLFLHNIIYTYPSVLVHNFYLSVFEKRDCKSDGEVSRHLQEGIHPIVHSQLIFRMVTKMTPIRYIERYKRYLAR